MVNPKARLAFWILFLAICLILASFAVKASEVVIGQKYVGSPVACIDPKDAQKVVEAFLEGGQEKSSVVIMAFLAESKCVAGVRFDFVVTKNISKHSNKAETMYIIEVNSDGLVHHIINDKPAVKPKKKEMLNEA